MSESHLSDDPSWNARAFSIASQAHKNRNLKKFPSEPLLGYLFKFTKKLFKNCDSFVPKVWI